MKRGSKKNRLLDYWLGIPLLNLVAGGRRRRAWPGPPARLGVMCSPALGDTLLFSGVLADLRAAFPRAWIVHFCMRSNLAAAEILAGADERVVLDLTNPAGSVRAMRAAAVDVLLDFTSWQRLTAFLTLASGAKFTAGFRSAGQHRGRAYDLAVEHRDDRHEVENFRAILGGLGIAAGSAPRVWRGGRAGSESFVGDGLAQAQGDGLSRAQDIVCLHPWASGQRSWLREWPPERWLELAVRLARPGTVFAITGAPNEVERIEPLVAALRQAGLDAVAFVGSDGLHSVARLLQRARLVVSVNTGVMHLAAIVGAPTVAINGPNRNGRWGPVGPYAIGVESPGEGCGYLHLGFNFDGQATDCMERISVEMVLAAAEEVMALAQAAIPHAPLAVAGGV